MYSNIPSGTNNYYNAVYIYFNWGTKYEIKKEGEYRGHSLGTIGYQEGNLSRTDMARIRCVRKATTTGNQ